MFTYDGLKRVNCSLHDTSVIIGGKRYEIISRKASEKSADIGTAIVIAVVTIGLGVEGCREFFWGDRIGSLFLVLPSLIFAPMAYYLSRLALITRKCRSQWVINRYHSLYIEPSDNPDIENNLIDLNVSDGSELPNPARTIKIAKSELIILILLIIASSICFWLRTAYWEGVCIIAAAYGIYLRLKDCVDCFIRLKWANDAKPN